MKKILITLLTLASLSQAYSKEFVIASTGDPNGTYNRMMGSICQAVNRDIKDIHCLTSASEGSLENLKRLSSGKAKIGIAQSDVLLHNKNQYPNIKALMGLYTETIFIVATQDSQINSIEDLKGKRLNLGPKGSGIWETAQFLLKTADIKLDTLSAVTETSAYGNDLRNQLCNKSIDATFYIEGTPATALHKLISDCNVKLIGLPKWMINALATKDSCYVKTVLPADTYHQTSSLETLGINAVLIASDELSDAHAASIVQEVIDKKVDLQSIVPAFKNTDTKTFVFPKHFVPLHSGAKQYLESKKLM